MPINIKRISQVFSRREKKGLPSPPKLSETTRIRVIQYFMDSFSPSSYSYFGSNPLGIMSVDIRKNLLLMLGRHQLDHRNPVRFLNEENAANDLLQFLHQCSDDNFFDFIELIFPTYMENPYISIDLPPNNLVGAFNDIFEMEGEQYRLTQMQEVPSSAPNDSTSEFLPVPATSYRTVYTIEYPKVIHTSDQALADLSIAPALRALSEGEYATPNEEFRKALEHQRKGQYTDSLRSSCSALESVLKILCSKNERNGQDFNHETLSRLIPAVFEHLDLDKALKQDIQSVGTIRSRYSNAHGGGENPKRIDRHTSEYVLTKTAALIVLLVNSH